MEFITLDSKVQFKNGFLVIKKVKLTKYSMYPFYLVLFFITIIGYYAYRAVTEKPYNWILVITFFMAFYPMLENAFNYLFVYKHGNKLPTNEMTEFKNLLSDNELEEIISIKFKGGRTKNLVFRKAENQMDGFVLKLIEEIAVK